MAGVTETTVAILAAIGGVFGIRSGTEEPRFTVVERVGAVEIRHYGPRLAAETTVPGDAITARNAGFRAVAGYIFGANTAGSSIAMTAPVAQASDGPSQTIAMTAPVAQEPAPGADGRWRVQFFMPAHYTRESLPIPKDSNVRIVEVPAQDYAVLRFSGSRDARAVQSRTADLQKVLAASRWRITGPSAAWFYDPPWTPPFLRRNEVVTPVQPAV
jgi:hypothetical protein